MLHEIVLMLHEIVIKLLQHNEKFDEILLYKQFGDWWLNLKKATTTSDNLRTRRPRTRRSLENIELVA